MKYSESKPIQEALEELTSLNAKNQDYVERLATLRTVLCEFKGWACVTIYHKPSSSLWHLNIDTGIFTKLYGE